VQLPWSRTARLGHASLRWKRACVGGGWFLPPIFPARALLVTTKPIPASSSNRRRISLPVIYTTPSAIAVDSTGAITIAGSTNSSTLPSAASPIPRNAIAQFEFGGIYRPSRARRCKVVWGTYVPLSSAPTLTAPSILGVPVDTINAVALDSSGNVVFTGVAAAGFPVSSDALQSAFPSGPAGPVSLTRDTSPS